jgi:hypothetical protein
MPRNQIDHRMATECATTRLLQNDPDINEAVQRRETVTEFASQAQQIFDAKVK